MILGGFGGGKVTVKIPVKISSDDFAVVYIADDGTTTVIENATYENGILTLELDHFSIYAIVQDTLLGDVNGDGEVDTTDAYFIVMYYNEMMDLTEEQLAAADVNGDGDVDTTDAYYIVLLYHDVLIIAKLYFGSCILGVNHLITNLHLHGYFLAVYHAARSDCDNLCLLWLFLCLTR